MRTARAKKDAYAIRWCNCWECLRDGSGRPLDIRQGRTAVIIVPENASGPRYLYLDRSTHVGEDIFDPTTYGDSIARLGGRHARRRHDRVPSGSRHRHDSRRRAIERQPRTWSSAIDCCRTETCCRSCSPGPIRRCSDTAHVRVPLLPPARRLRAAHLAAVRSVRRWSSAVPRRKGRRSRDALSRS
jgi:hypothetical protein